MALSVKYYQLVTRNWLNEKLEHLDDERCFCDSSCKSCYRLKIIKTELIEGGIYTHHKKITWWKISEDKNTNAITVTPELDY